MKVLFIGHYKEQSGWGKAARDYILALDAAGVDVVPRTVKLNSTMPEIPERIKELESKSSRGATHCIQHVLPHHLDFNGRFEKNIALAVYESFNAKLSSWPAKINLMDELWVPSEFTSLVFDDMGVNIPTKIVPHAFDMSVYSKKYEKIENKELEGNYIFYTIADSNKRKDLLSLIQAFHLEFTANEPVRLLIKTGKYGVSPSDCAKAMIHECNTVKAAMKLMRRPEDYSQEIIVADNLSDEDIYRLHATGDCFVSTSHGEAWCIPLFEAAAFGKTCVYPYNIFGYMNESNGTDGSVYTRESIVFGMNDTFQDLGSSREHWDSVDIKETAFQMRQAYEGKIVANNKDLNQYSYKNVGELMKLKLELKGEL